MSDRLPKLYGELAGWFHLVTAPHEYEEEASIYAELLGEARTVLELGSGGGNNASHLTSRFEMTLVDRSEAMLELSRSINPACRHVVGDMRTVRLGETFDAVFVHDAVDYLTTPGDLRAAMATARAHLAPGGVALFCPDHVRETFEPRTEHGGYDEADRGLRYLEWVWDPDPADDTYVADFVFLLREGRETRAVQDRHVCGLFPRQDWLGWLRAEGFATSEVAVGDAGIDLFLGRA